MNGAALGDLEQLQPLLGSERPGEFEFAIDAIEKYFLGFAIGAVFGVNFGMLEAYGDFF